MGGTTSRKLTCTLGRNTQLAANIYRITLVCPDLALMMKPGQFFELAVPGNAAELLRLPFSYASSRPDAGEVDLIYQVVGSGTQRLSALLPGTQTDLIGPLGHGFELLSTDELVHGRVALVGGGLGLAPLLGLAQQLQDEQVVFDAVVAATTKNRLYGLDILSSYGADKTVITTDDGSEGLHGFACAGFELLLKEHRYDAVYTCGPMPMMRGIALVARRLQIPCQVSLETGMLCGIGCCMSCVIKTVDGPAGVCAAGPVFDAKKVIFDD